MDDGSGMASSMLLDPPNMNKQSMSSLAYLSAHLSNPKMPTLQEMRKMESQLDRKLREPSPDMTLMMGVSASKIPKPQPLPSSNTGSSSKPISTLQ